MGKSPNQEGPATKNYGAPSEIHREYGGKVIARPTSTPEPVLPVREEGAG